MTSSPALVSRRSSGRRWYATAVAMLAVLATLSGCGQAATVAEPPHDAVSSVPVATGTPTAGVPLALKPGSVTPTPPATTGSSGGGGGGGGGGSITLGDAAVGPLTFGMHVNQLASAAWPTVPVGAFRILNADSTWGGLEPSPGQWDFARLDDRVATARAAGARVLLVLGQPPAWAASRPDLHSYGGSPSPPRDFGDWSRYVAAVAARYRGQIEAYEVWNEPNLPQFFVSSPSQLGELTRLAATAIRAADPAAKVVSPGFSARTGGADTFFRSYVASGIRDAIDVVGIHIYPYPGNGPESMVGLAQHFAYLASSAGLGSKPMWNTEIGYGSTPSAIIDDATAASLILRTYLVLPAAGLDRNYWYLWDDRQFTGLYLVGPDRRTPTVSADRYADAQRWLSGGEVLECHSAASLWTCSFRTAPGPTVTIAWSVSGTSTLVAPPSARVLYTFGGGAAPVTAGASISVGLAPVMIAPSELPGLG